MRPVHKKKRLRKLINDGQLYIEQIALNNDLGWGPDDITDAILSLRQADCYDSRPKGDNPEAWYDYYRGYFMGEPFYTHFYIENDMLVIDSFKKRFQS